MKKLFITFVFICFVTLATKAQERSYYPFRVDAGMNAATTLFSGSSLGLGYYIEPRYAFNAHFSLGLQYNEMFLMNTSENIDFRYNMELMATGDYFFNTSTFRPFVGAGVGLSWLIGGGTDTGVGGGSAPAILVRTGFDVWQVRFAVSYNYGGTYEQIGSYDYLALSVGFFIGGGKRK